MKSIKTFCKENKRKFMFIGSMVGVAVISVLVDRRLNVKADNDPYEGLTVISWEESGRFIDLEKVKEVLDLNADNSESFAIVKGMVTDNKELYKCVLISDGVVTDKPEEA